MEQFKELLARFDKIQQGSPWLSFPVAVAKKFGDDQAGYLASLVAYYGFFSIFPLLLVFTTILGFALKGNPDLEGRIIASATRNVPVISKTSISSLTSHSSGLALATGIVFTLLSGLAVIQAMENNMDEVWGIPFVKRANWIFSRVRALIMLAVLGLTTLLAAALSSLSAVHIPLAGRILGPVGSLLVNFLTVALAFKVLTAADIAWRDIIPGAAIAALALDILQTFGSAYVKHIASNPAYGTFGIIIGLLSYIYLGAQITFYAAEINVVKAKGLWPRSVVAPTTPADHKALALQATKQQRTQDEVIEVDFASAPHKVGDRT